MDKQYEKETSTSIDFGQVKTYIEYTNHLTVRKRDKYSFLYSFRQIWTLLNSAIEVNLSLSRLSLSLSLSIYIYM